MALLAACEPDTSIRTSCENTKQLLGTFIALPAGSLPRKHVALYPEERQGGELVVNGFKLLAHEVTNAEFTKFVEATGYVTDAEKNLDKQNPGAGSALFSKDSNDEGSWKLVQGAIWRQPEGPGSDLKGKEHHPVIHVSHNDASSYARWKGGRLPTEIEWEYAASLGLQDRLDRLSGAYNKQGKPIANTWQGLFPMIDSGDDGFTSTSPVGCFQENEIGLVDMIGNVWEWTDTVYADRRHTIKGGSFLCAKNFCRRYRPEARQPHESNFSTNHIGFRIVVE